jgi:hypothetical protein
MPRVKRIALRVEIEDDDGAVHVHEVDGTPIPPSTCEIVPHYRQTFSRSSGVLSPQTVVEVGITLSARVKQGDGLLFSVTEGEPVRREIVAHQTVVVPEITAEP